MIRVAVVGANSYIARNVIYYLKESYNDVLLDLYDFADSHVDNEINYHKIDILDTKSVSTINMNCDYIFMFVGKTGSADGFDNSGLFIDVNEKSILNVLNEYRSQSSKAKIIFPSTRLVYKGSDVPLAEEAEKEFKTIYAINKYACEQYLEQYNRVYNVNYCIFRICVPYGTLIKNASSYGTAEFMLSKASNGKNISLYGDGSVKRTITHMEDLCKIIVEGAFCPKCINGIFNVGGEEYTLKEMAEKIAEKYGVSVEYVPWPEIALKIESGSTVFDDSKLQNLGFKTQKKFDDWLLEYEV